jgi:hypothetical protein
MMRLLILSLIAPLWLGVASPAGADPSVAPEPAAKQDRQRTRPPGAPLRPAQRPVRPPADGPSAEPPQSTPDPQFSRRRVTVRGVTPALCILGADNRFQDNCSVEPVERCPAAMTVMSDGASYACELECDSIYPDASGNCSCEVVLTAETCTPQ